MILIARQFAHSLNRSAQSGTEPFPTLSFWLLIALFSIGSAHAGEVTMKEILYLGGLVTFSVPNHWIEKYESDGGGMFYEDAPDTGPLRLNVIAAKSPAPLSLDSAFKQVIAIKGVKAGSAQRLKNGNAIATSIQHSSEQGHAITIYWWCVTNPIWPTHLRFANFSFTVLTRQENSERTKREVQRLTDSIKNAKFLPTLGL